MERFIDYCFSIQYANEFMSQKRVLIKVLAPFVEQRARRSTTRRQLKLYPDVLSLFCPLRV